MTLTILTAFVVALTIGLLYKIITMDIKAAEQEVELRREMMSLCKTQKVLNEQAKRICEQHEKIIELIDNRTKAS